MIGQVILFRELNVLKITFKSIRAGSLKRFFGAEICGPGGRFFGKVHKYQLISRKLYHNKFTLLQVFK